MKYTKTIGIIALSLILTAQTAPSIFAASEIKELEDVVDDFLWFDNEGDIREASLSQGKNVVTSNGITTYYNLYGEAIMQRIGNKVTINLKTDENGNVTHYSVATVTQVAEGEVISSVSDYEIGPDGKKRIIKSYSPGGETVYTYDKDGNQISEMGFTRDANGNPTSYREIVRGYDDNGNITSMDFVNKNGDGSVRHSATKEWTYDESGNRTSTIVTNRTSTGSVSNSFEYEYTYDANGNQLTETSRQKNSSGNVTSSAEHTSAYDANGNLTSKNTTYKNANGTVRSINERNYSYDANGNEIALVALYKDPSGNVTSSNEYNYTYDANGNQSTKIVTNKNASGAVSSSSEETYIYDADGNRTEATTLNKNSSGTVTSSAVSEYEYSEESESGAAAVVKTTNKNANGDVTSIYKHSLSTLGEQSYSGTQLSFNTDGDLTRVYSYGSGSSASLNDSGGVSFFFGSNVEYERHEEDGSYTNTTIGTVREGSEEVSTVDTTWTKDLSSSIESINTENFSSTGASLGYNKTDLSYDSEGKLTGSTVLKYEGSWGATYAGKTEFSNYVYNDAGKVEGYTKTTYDVNDAVTETTVYTNTVYDAYNRKKQADYTTTDASGDVIESGTKTY